MRPIMDEFLCKHRSPLLDLQQKTGKMRQVPGQKHRILDLAQYEVHAQITISPSPLLQFYRIPTKFAVKLNKNETHCLSLKKVDS